MEDKHDINWAIDRLYKIEADFTSEGTATARNDAKAIVLVLEEINQNAVVLEAFDRAIAARRAQGT
jgi:hypothetical protein